MMSSTNLLNSLLEAGYVRNTLDNIVREHRNNFLETLFDSFVINIENEDQLETLIRDNNDFDSIS